MLIRFFPDRDSPMGSWLRISITLLLWPVLLSPIHAEPVLPHLFSDHMVLQRDSDIRIWGWADPGEKISVSLAGSTRAASALQNARII